MTPKGMVTRPPSRSMAGDDRVHRAACRPPASFGWPSCRVKPAPRLWNRMPNLSDAKPEPKSEDRVDQRHGHAVAIDHGDVDRVLVHLLRWRPAAGHGALRVDQRGQRAAVSGLSMCSSRVM
jgi:hypothetical protein